MRVRCFIVAFTFAALLLLLSTPSAMAQTPAASTEFPLQRCDGLPVVILQVDKTDKRFLIDTAATSLLNAKSFYSMRAKEVRIQSWNKTTALNASDVSIGQLSLGNHIIRNVRLPAIDLSAISKACGGPLDGILGVDLLEQLGVTIDLKRGVARFAAAPPNSAELALIAEMHGAMQSCSEAFNSADAEKLSSCFDADFVLSSPGGELHGRDEAMNHIRREYFAVSPHPRLSVTISDQRAVGDVVWSLYDYSIESPSVHRAGRGMMICRKSANRWYILSMHESFSSPL